MGRICAECLRPAGACRTARSRDCLAATVEHYRMQADEASIDRDATQAKLERLAEAARNKMDDPGGCPLSGPPCRKCSSCRLSSVLDEIERG